PRLGDPRGGHRADEEDEDRHALPAVAREVLPPHHHRPLQHLLGAEHLPERRQRADGLSLALFVNRAGAGRLPFYYAATAPAKLVLVGAYVLLAERVGGARVFSAALGGSVAVYAAGWVALRWLGGGGAWYGALFVTREVGYTARPASTAAPVSPRPPGGEAR